VRNIQWDLTGAIAAWALGDKAKSDALIAEALTLYPDRAELVRQIANSRAQITGTGS